jgi:hypothetical protein
MKQQAPAQRRWPVGYRLVLWLVGSLAVLVIITAALFILSNTAR